MPVGEIRSFLKASLDQQEMIIDHWRRVTESKLQELQVAKQYLNGTRPGVRSVNLVRWEESCWMIWFTHELASSIHPFAQSIAEDRKTLTSSGFGTTAEAFVLLLEARGKTLLVEIGFRLSSGASLDLRGAVLQHSDWPERYRTEKLDPTLFATLETRADDPLMCIRYSRMLDRYGFRPTGPRWERYETGLEELVMSYIPVLPKEQVDFPEIFV